VKAGYVVLMISGNDYLWNMHILCFAGIFKFKQNIPSKPGICLHQIREIIELKVLMSPNA